MSKDFCRKTHKAVTHASGTFFVLLQRPYALSFLQLPPPACAGIIVIHGLMAHTKRLKCTILAGSFPRLCAVRRKTRTQRWHSHRRTCLKLKLAAGVPSQCAEVPGSADDTKQVHSKRSLRLTRSGCAILGSDVRIMQIIHITHHTHAHAHASISYLSTASCSRVPTSRKLFFGNVSVCHLSVCVCKQKWRGP